jgi:hypothetical protein
MFVAGALDVEGPGLGCEVRTGRGAFGRVVDDEAGNRHKQICARLTHVVGEIDESIEFAADDARGCVQRVPQARRHGTP